MLMEIIVFVIALFFFFSGGIPLLGYFKICRKGIKTSARVRNVRQTAKNSSKTSAIYTADIIFKLKNGKTLQMPYTSSGDYLTLFMDKEYEREAEIIYNEDNPYKFFIPRDKGEIGWNIIFCTIGFVMTIVFTFIFLV